MQKPILKEIIQEIFINFFSKIYCLNKVYTSFQKSFSLKLYHVTNIQKIFPETSGYLDVIG